MAATPRESCDILAAMSSIERASRKSCVRARDGPGGSVKGWGIRMPYLFAAVGFMAGLLLSGILLSVIVTPAVVEYARWRAPLKAVAGGLMLSGGSAGALLGYSLGS